MDIDTIFDDVTEKKARSMLLELVARYYERYHRPKLEKKYVPGERINYAGRVYGASELKNLVDSALSFWLTRGEYTDLFEDRLKRYLGAKYALTTNSGSSANLLAFMALCSKDLGDRAIKRGDEVITVACGFPTTLSPIINFGAVPVFTDITIPGYNIDVGILEDALSDKTKAVMIAHTLGNPFDLARVLEFCKAHDLWLIEDNCDALGSRYYLDGRWRYTGTFGDFGTSSFYPAHHITMGEGGAVYTDDPQLKKLAQSLRDWGRDCVCPPGHDDTCGHRFDGRWGQLPAGYDHKYVYSSPGYNLGVTDMQSAIGVAQLERLSWFDEKRKYNWEILREELVDLRDRVILPEATKNSDPAWFGFCMTLVPGIDRRKVLEYIEEKNVQTRLLFGGNLIRQPFFDSIRGDKDSYRVIGTLKNTDMVTEQSFWVGVYPGLDDDRLYYMAETIKEAVRRI